MKPKPNSLKKHDCDHIIYYTQEDVAKRVRELTDGEGVAVVYDGVGKDTFMCSLDSLRIRGMMINFGNASGPVPPFDAVSSEIVKVEVHQTCALAEAANAHRDLEARKTTGSTVLLPTS